MDPVETQVEELADNRVRLTVDVPSHDVKHAVEHAASDLAGSLRIPGFRKGKVPMPVLLARVGKKRLYSEAVESHIGGWFWNAAARSRIHPVEQPEFGYDLPDSDADAFQFTATVAVAPKPEVADWTTLEVPFPEDAEIPAELIDRELEALQATVAELVPVEDRPAREGDTVVIDLVSSGGDAQRDYVVELGAGRVVDEVEEALVGMSPGDTKEVSYELADGSRASLEVVVKDIKEKVLPPLDDDVARATSEFDTLAELRDDITRRLSDQLADELDSAFRGAAIDALVDASHVTASGPLVETRTKELVNLRIQSLEQRGISVETYLSVTQKTPEQFVTEAREDASRSVARELVLEAVAEQLGIAVSDDEVKALIREQAEAAGEDPDATIEQFSHSGAHERVRDDLRLRAAADRVAAEVKRISPDLARAREALWTPGQEKPHEVAKLWTPSSKEHG